MKVWTKKGVREFSLASEFADFLNNEISAELTHAVNIWETLEALELFSNELESEFHEVKSFLSKKNLYRKLVRELGEDFERELRAAPRERGLLEGYRPLGVLAHITPGNDAVVGFLAAIEGILTGNINLLKASSAAGALAQTLFQKFYESPNTESIKSRLLLCEFSSSDKEALNVFLGVADGVSAWGGESTLQDIRSKLPVGVRFIPWGHRLSFAYLSSQAELYSEMIEAICNDVTLYAQQACSAPQVLYVEGDFAKACEVAREIYQRLCHVAGESELDRASQTEVTNYTLLKISESALGLSEVHGDQAGPARVIAINNSTLEASPLHNTLLVKPIQRSEILSVLRPMRAFLQTIGLHAASSEVSELCDLFYACGATRITPWGKMQESYVGEPHDGERALCRFLKRVRVESHHLENVTKWSETTKCSLTPPVNQKVTTKSEFMGENAISEGHRFVFKSGGSSGVQAISPFSSADYHRQMQFAADGLLSAGLDPANDRVMNLFFGGQLYGGFISFTDILEKCDALQFPMGAHTDYQMVAEQIIAFNVNTLMGMPSFLYTLFSKAKSKLKNYRGIKKIFYGGEFITKEVREWYALEFGIELIKSASYGSVDAGPVAYQCLYSEGGVHHLHHGLHALEILKLDEDAQVVGSETGRLIYTTPSRLSTKVSRYELGDLGRWVDGECPCGHRSPRFELQGRLGDIFRAGGNFFNYQVFEQLLRDKFNYHGLFQITLKRKTGLDELTFSIEKGPNLADVLEVFKNEYYDFCVAIEEEKCLFAEFQSLRGSDFVTGSASGKVKRVLDMRSNL